MKKILLATTILGMTAGFAAAEVKLSGSAKMGVARVGGTAAVAAVQGTHSADTAEFLGSSVEEGDAVSAAQMALLITAAASTQNNADNLLEIAESGSLWTAVTSAETALAAATAAQDAEGIAAAEAALADAVEAYEAGDAYLDYIDAQGAADSAAALVGDASGTAGVAAVATGSFHAYSSVKIKFSGSGVTDGGVEFGASTDTTIGAKYDSLGDFDGDSVISSGNTGSWGIPTVYLSGSFGKISFSANNLDFFDDANNGGDVQYDYTAGDVTVGLVADLESSNYSAKLSANVGGVALSVDADTYDIWNASAAYTSGPATITLSANEADVQKIKVAYSADGMSASAKFGTDDSWEITGGYTAGALSLALLADSGEYQEVTISNDLGGGALIVAGANSDQDMFAGVELSF